MTKSKKDDRKSYRGQLLRDLKQRARPENESKPDEKKPVQMPSESVLKNVKSDPYLAELRSKYKPK